MAWGPNANTEEELEKLAAVRAYLEGEFPNSTVHDSYDLMRMAQVFRVELEGEPQFRDAIVSTEFLDDSVPDVILNKLSSWRVAEYMGVSGAEIVVTHVGIRVKEG